MPLRRERGIHRAAEDHREFVHACGRNLARGRDAAAHRKAVGCHTGRLRAGGDPAANQVDAILRQRYAWPSGMRPPTAACALDLVHDVALVRIARVHAQQGRHFVARDVHQHRVAVGRVEPQSLRRIGADVALRADRRENRVLDFLEVGIARRLSRNWLTILVQSFAASGGASGQNQHQLRQQKSFCRQKVGLFQRHADTPRFHCVTGIGNSRWHRGSARVKNSRTLG